MMPEQIVDLSNKMFLYKNVGIAISNFSLLFLALAISIALLETYRAEALGVSKKKMYLDIRPKIKIIIALILLIAASFQFGKDVCDKRWHNIQSQLQERTAEDEYVYIYRNELSSEDKYEEAVLDIESDNRAYTVLIDDTKRIIYIYDAKKHSFNVYEFIFIGGVPLILGITILIGLLYVKGVKKEKTKPQIIIE